jgi:putative transposase
MCQMPRDPRALQIDAGLGADRSIGQAWGCSTSTVTSGYKVPQQGSLAPSEVEEIKSVPYAPVSHPLVERLIGTIRREYLDRVFFWNAVDLARKLNEYKDYYNAHRVHRSLGGTTPAQCAGASSAASAPLDCHALRQHCRGLFQTPIPA